MRTYGMNEEQTEGSTKIRKDRIVNQLSYTNKNTRVFGTRRSAPKFKNNMTC